MHPTYSLIVPVYNRPGEVDELLESLTHQTLKTFEVVIVEDGSAQTCEQVVDKFKDRISITYAYQTNTGPGPARNHGAQLAKAPFWVFLDSDVILPPQYIQTMDEFLGKIPLDCFGGPDRAHESFTPIQKAISYAMTSPLTTGGIRGSKKTMDRFYPRSFNLGITAEAYKSVKGFSAMRFGEDLDLSMRLIEKGFRTGLIADAFVYHKRRTSFKSFYKQVFNSGVARINLEKRHPGTLKVVHILPSVFVVVNIVGLAVIPFFWPIAVALLLPAVLFFVDALNRTNELQTTMLSVMAAYTQLFGYGLGFIKAYWMRNILKKEEFHSFQKNFYK
jgi:glycosyltransferase involved in cell wall biosynthesis